jgi:hypothetical protein
MSYLFSGIRYLLTGIIALPVALLLFLLVALVVTALAGCMVGPKYVKPSTPTPAVYKEQPPASYQGVSLGLWLAPSARAVIPRRGASNPRVEE